MDTTSKEDAPKAESNEDDWHTVTDAKKRKQIQDRLAQRNRRKRLREAKKNEGGKLQDTGNQPAPESQIEVQRYCHPLLEIASEADWINSLGTLPPRPETDPSMLPSSQSMILNTSSMHHTCNISFEIPYQQTVFSALYMNGEILGLICGIHPRQSPPVSLNVPPALHPTPTQLLTVHNTGYDRFPFSKMRDNIIIHNELIDDEEFFRDIFTMPCFTIKPGGTPWDPSAWKIEKPFADKWGFLFY